YAWCATYIVACAREVGLRLPSESAYTPTMADGFRQAGRWFTQPHPGDIAFVDFPNDNTRGIQHVAVVTGVEGFSLRTVEGNTSSGTQGSQDNGGGVYQRIRPRGWIVGYGRPAFDGDPSVLGEGIITSDEETEMATVVTRPQGGYIVVQHDGGVFAYDGAPYVGSVPGTPSIKLGGNVIGGAWSESGQGYWLLARDGAVYAFGDARYMGGFNSESPATKGRRYAVGLVRTSPNSYRVVTFDPSGDGSTFDGYEYRATA
ncbi:MAG TPA: CHAP domain-containing protein, partial [Actinomycetota bacterium]